jgi:hypothetical protein
MKLMAAVFLLKNSVLKEISMVSSESYVCRLPALL